MTREEKLLGDKARWQKVYDDAHAIWVETKDPLANKRRLNANKNLRRVNEALYLIGPTVGSVNKELRKAAL